MTEEEAKQRWCPFARTVTDYDERILGPFNRDDMVPGSGNTSDIISQALCIGSACMAWRWSDPEPPHPVVADRRRGYCGLAGKP